MKFDQKEDELDDVTDTEALKVYLNDKLYYEIIDIQFDSKNG